MGKAPKDWAERMIGPVMEMQRPTDDTAKPHSCLTDPRVRELVEAARGLVLPGEALPWKPNEGYVGVRMERLDRLRTALDAMGEKENL